MLLSLQPGFWLLQLRVKLIQVRMIQGKIKPTLL